MHNVVIFNNDLPPPVMYLRHVLAGCVAEGRGGLPLHVANPTRAFAVAARRESLASRGYPHTYNIRYREKESKTYYSNLHKCNKNNDLQYS